jgi:uncharacterized protein (UPF0332 family)
MEAYFDRLKHSLDSSKESEWWQRTAKSAKHILTAVCFREVSQSTSEKTGNVIFSPIGFYYSLFHMGVAMLYMEHTTTQQELVRMRHSNLQALIQGRLVNTHLLPKEYLELLRELQDLREYANYVFGERIAKYEYKNMVSGLYAKTGSEFDHALEFILRAENEVCGKLGFIAPIQVAIGDGFGDDLIRTYLSPEDETKVKEYFLEKDLTT